MDFETSKSRGYVRNMKVIPSEECVRLHHLVVGNIVFKDWK